MQLNCFDCSLDKTVVSLDNYRENYIYFAASKILVLKVDDGLSLLTMLIVFGKTALKTVRLQTNALFYWSGVAYRRYLHHPLEYI